LSKFPLGLELSSASLEWPGIVVERYSVPRLDSNPADTSEITLYIQREQPSVAVIEEPGKTVNQSLAIDEICVIPAGWSGSMSFTQPSSFLSVRLDPAYLAGILDERVRPRHLEVILKRGFADPQILHTCLALEQELRSQGETGRTFVEALTAALAARLIRLYSAAPFSPSQYRTGLPKYALRLAMDYIDANLGQNVRLDNLARLVNMSPYHFARLFRQSTGTAPHRYLIEQRIARAKALLANPSRSIADVAHEVGYQSQSHFTSVFREITGLTPKQFRDL
jgi:AraC family transcriptional regulator